MNDNEIIKAFAKLDSVGIIESCGKFWTKVYYMGELVSREYNPLKNYHLTFKAMLKYKVQKITDKSGYHTVHIDEHHRVSQLIDEELQKGMIVCILKSKGLWTGTYEDIYND